MAIVYLVQENLDQNNTPGVTGSSYKGTVTAGTTGDVVILPRPFDRPISVSVDPFLGGSALVEYTMDVLASVVSDPNAADWHEWDDGTVNIHIARGLFAPVVALRCTASTADCVFKVNF